MCPTCSAILKHAYSIKDINHPSLKEIRDSVNDKFNGLDDFISKIKPLLSLLDSGLYVISDMLAFPTNGDSFFWNNYSDHISSAREIIQLHTDDNQYYQPFDLFKYPLYLYSTENTLCHSEERVNYYLDKYKDFENAPRTIVYKPYIGPGLIIDGHHKVCAATLSGKMARCVTIRPVSISEYHKSIFGNIVVDECCINYEHLDCVKINLKDIPEKLRKIYKTNKKSIPNNTINLPKGIKPIEKNDSQDLNKLYQKALSNYPNMEEYQYMCLCDIENKEEVDEYINHPDKDINMAKSIMISLFYKDKNRFKKEAIKCFDQTKKYDLLLLDLQTLIFKYLKKIKNDKIVEDFFTEFLSECSDRYSTLFQIANSYWE